MPELDLLTPLIILGILVMVMAYFWGKRNKAGMKGAVYSQVVKQFEIYINLDTLTVGRLAGASAKQKIDAEYTYIRYKKGLMNFPEPDRVPDDAIVTFQPPQSRMMEGICLVLPWREGSPLTKFFPMTRLVVEQKRIINSLKNRANLLEEIIEEGGNTQIALQHIKHISNIATDLKGNMAEMTKDTPVIETAQIKEPKKAKGTS